MENGKWKMEKLGHSIVHIERIYESWAKHRGITNLNLLWLYLSLFTYPHRSQQEICAEFCITKQTLSLLCKSLLKEGVIEYANVCVDKREKRLQLSEKGRAEAMPIIAELHEFEERVFATFGEQNGDKLLSLMQLLSETMEAEFQKEIQSAK